jgi:dipicolinate synthase subunit B
MMGMKLDGINIGFGITGSFCTFEKVLPEAEKLVKIGAKVHPIFSFNAAAIDTRFGKAKDWITKFEDVTSNKAIMTIGEAEPIGPKNLIDILVIAPCTPNPFIIQNI